MCQCYSKVKIVKEEISIEERSFTGHNQSVNQSFFNESLYNLCNGYIKEQRLII